MVKSGNFGKKEYIFEASQQMFWPFLLCPGFRMYNYSFLYYRWEVVASFINQHSKSPEIVRSAKETLNKAKEMQSGDFSQSSLKDEVNKNAYENLEKQKKTGMKVDDVGNGTERFDSASEVQGVNVEPWSGEEQKLLEQALKTFPASVGAERWDKIAECLPNRSKKDCMRRYKELATLLKAKKAAQLAAAKGK